MTDIQVQSLPHKHTGPTRPGGSGLRQSRFSGPLGLGFECHPCPLLENGADKLLALGAGLCDHDKSLGTVDLLIDLKCFRVREHKGHVFDSQRLSSFEIIFKF
jgi:hypothetical protein